jgi:hypothetical protein
VPLAGPALSGRDGAGSPEHSGEEAVAGEAEPGGLPTPEARVDAFVAAVDRRDEESCHALFINDQVADPVWGRIIEYDLTFDEGYQIEEAGSSVMVDFDTEAARWSDAEAELSYEQQRGIAQWNADEDTIEGQLFNGRPRRRPLRTRFPVPGLNEPDETTRHPSHRLTDPIGSADQHGGVERPAQASEGD